MRSVTIHPGSALTGAATLALVLLAAGAAPQRTTLLSSSPSSPEKPPTKVEIVNIPQAFDAARAVRILNGSPFTVPAGTRFVATGLGRTSSQGGEVGISIDGVTVWFGSLTSNAQTTHDVPSGVVAGPGALVSATGTAAVVLGYLIDA